MIKTTYPQTSGGGAIYVVIEQYQIDRLKDRDLDRLLADKQKVDALRRFRNAIFHVQKDIIPQKELDLLNEDREGEWVREVHQAFGRFFLRVLPIKEMFSEIQEKNGK